MSHLEQEDYPAGFLCVRSDCNESVLLKMKQEGLIDHVIEALGLDVGTVNGKVTPAKAKLLIKDTDGEVAHDDFSYSSVVETMLYLSGHSRRNIAYAVNCDRHHMFCPRHSHELTLKRTERYLKATYSR